MPPQKLEKPWTRRQLIVELATSGKTQAKLAEEYGVVESSISEFKTRHRQTIEQVRADQENEFAGIAIAEKATRLATYLDVLDTALKPVPKVNAKGEIMYGLPDESGEELGHLPNRVTLGGEVGVTTNYKINGVEPENLR
jgi:acyl-CoA hydrolase